MFHRIKLLSFSALNNIGATLVFFIALITYTLTLEPTTSFWDCGEYIATAHKIQVGHPPGAPFFILIANFFSNLTLGEVTNVAWMINFMSALCSALTIVFLFWIITRFSHKILQNQEAKTSTFSKFSIIFSGLIGSLIYTFSDSFWFSAVEGEVYAMSSLFTAVVFWCILKWESEFNKDTANRWLVLIAFLIGLSVGVHMLNLLAIPAITSIYLYKKWQEKNYTNLVKFILINIIGILILALIFYIIVPEIVNLFGKTELYFVNKLGLGFNSGTLFFLITVIVLIITSLIISHKKNSPNLNTITLSFMFFLIGYSSFFVLIIRSNANTPIDENSPEDAVSLLAYLNREQYGSHPLLYGQSFNSKDSTFVDGNPVYVQGYELNNRNGRFKWKGENGKLVYKEEFSTKEKAEEKKETLLNLEKSKSLDFEINDKYIISDARKDWKTIYKKNDESFFPRMWSNSDLHKYGRSNDGYLGWSGKKNEKEIPSLKENISFFWNYQMKHMYIRYFMWNFSGKQNDIQGHGNKLDGNWITGINLIDNHLLGLGPQKELPKHLKENAGNNKYFLLPFLLGLFGMIFHSIKRKQDFWAIFLLFFFTGIAIVIQLNQTPYQPRERDYAYVGSFFAFAIWTGIGALGVLQILKIQLKKTTTPLLLSLILLGIPTLMAYENWDDHDRSNRYTARDFAKNYLSSCKPNAILFTMGDNDTFPLWYVQEVEGYRTDVRVVNLSLLNTDWYIDQMKKDAYDGKAVPFSLERDLYKQGTRDVAYFYPYSALIKDKLTIEELEANIKSLIGEPANTYEIKNYLNHLFSMISKKDRARALESLGEMLQIPVSERQNFLLDSTKLLESKGDLSAPGVILFTDSTVVTEKIFYLSDFNKWIKNNENYTKINLTKNKAHVYFPMNKIKIPVNKGAVLRKNIVMGDDIKLIEDSLLVDFSKTAGLDKKSLMILDLLEQNNWERPVYFAITIGDPNQNPEPFLFLNDYLQLDGMVYQLVPIKNTSNESGRINSDVLYDNLMNNFQWGGIDVSNNIYIDETNARMIRNFKNIFNRLASKLIEEGDVDKAEDVIKKSLNTIKHELVPLEIYDLPLLENYFNFISEIKIEASDSLNLEYENLNNLTSTLINRYNAELKYYNSFPKNQLKKDWVIQNQLKLAAQSLSALYLLKNEIPIIINENDNLTLDETNKIIDECFTKTIQLIETTYNSKYKSEARNLLLILKIYTEIINTTEHPQLNDFLIELDRISNLVNPKLPQTTSNINMCSCIQQDLNNTITNDCITYLNNLFSGSEDEINEEASNCPELFQLFIQKQIQAMEAAEKAGEL